MPRTPASTGRAAPRQLVSLAKAAEACDVSTRTILRWIRDGRLRAYRVGPALVRIDLDDLDAIVRPVAQAPVEYNHAGPPAT